MFRSLATWSAARDAPKLPLTIYVPTAVLNVTVLQ